MFPSMERFAYERPKSLGEALSLAARLKKSGERFAFFGGGTDLIPALKEHGLRIGTLVSLSGIEEIKGVRRERDKKLIIGAGTTLFDLLSNPAVGKLFPALADAAGRIASPQIRFRATVGGNLLVDNRCRYYNQNRTVRKTHGPCYKDGGDRCHFVAKRAPGAPPCRARSVSDLTPLFLLLDAAVELQGSEGTRKVPLREFYLPDGISRNRKRPDEILTRIDIPLPAPRAMRYEKLRVREAIDFPSVGVAAALTSDKREDRVGIALTGVDAQPLFFEFRSGDFPDEEALLEHAAREAAGAAVVLKQDFFPPAYRRKMIGVLIRRAGRALTPVSAANTARG